MYFILFTNLEHFHLASHLLGFFLTAVDALGKVLLLFC